MKIQPIVEGYGEVPAVPVLLRRLRDEAKAYGIEIGRPIRRNRDALVKEDQLRKAVRLAMLQPGCGAILILFDSHDDPPCELGPAIHRWANAESGTIPCAVVLAHREYEAWFLATIESLRGRRGIRNDAVSHPSPEEPRGAKERLEDRMEERCTYSETVDQAALTALFDMGAAYRRCRSFRHMASAFGALLSGAGVSPLQWPPASWVESGE